MNLLKNEKSPYLLQHAHNPVDWKPWGEAAFTEARARDVPVLVSIGYATCHWCHVMERESFEDPEIARVMNENLVCIKVDREERPDVDKVYMTAVQALTGQGGWPLNMFLTPDGSPFIGGTYFPPKDGFGRPGWPTLVRRIGDGWRDPGARQEMLERGRTLIDGISRHLSAPGEIDPNDPAVVASRGLDVALASYRGGYDAQNPGFAAMPKFPMPVNQHFLFRAWAFAPGRAEAVQGRDMALAALGAMARGGIHDHLGGGFARYSVDERWHVPHFEKMLYDNAQLAENFTEAFLIAGEEAFADTARGVLDYVLRDMTHPEGGFYSAEDADSAAAPGAKEKTEGAFYVWEEKETQELLGPSRAALFNAAYGVEKGGNVQSDPHGEFPRKNVLYRALSDDQLSARFGVPPEAVTEELAAARRALFSARARRPRPFLDDKVLMSWNGLMISALARAAGALEEPRYLEAALRAARFLQKNLFGKGGEASRRWRDGEAAVPAMADDLAFLSRGFLDLYEATLDERWLEASRGLADRLLENFSDGAGGFYMTPPAHDGAVPLWAGNGLRPKDDADNVEPAAASVAASVLLRLAEYADHPLYREAALKTLASHPLGEDPRRYPFMFSALLLAVGRPLQVVVAGDPADVRTAALWAVLRKRFLPGAVFFRADGPAGPATVRAMTPVGGAPAAYVCQGFACKAPVTDPRALSELLARP